MEVWDKTRPCPILPVALLLTVGLFIFLSFPQSFLTENFNIASTFFNEKIKRLAHFQRETITLNETLIQAFNSFKVPSYYNATWFNLLPNLTALSWPTEPIADKPAKPGDPQQEPFEPTMSKAQRSLYYHLLRDFAAVLAASNLGDQFMLNAGTLLGSLRHHDFVPWDEDIDVMVNSSCKSKVRELMKGLSPRYKFYEGEPRDKLYAQTISPTDVELDLERSRPVNAWAWPFLDISYFEDNQTHIRDLAVQSAVFKRDIVVPLHFRPFGRNWYPAPRDAMRFIQILFNPTVYCKSLDYSHVSEISLHPRTVLCRSLGQKYAFVRRGSCADRSKALSPDGMVFSNEELVLLNYQNTFKTIHSICLPVTPNNILGDAYSLGYFT